MAASETEEYVDPYAELAAKTKANMEAWDAQRNESRRQQDLASSMGYQQQRRKSWDELLAALMGKRKQAFGGMTQQNPMVSRLLGG